MKNLTLIFLIVVFASCNPFISKQLRDKNKCNRKVTRELNRHDKKIRKIAVSCPEILVHDTIKDTLIVELNKVEIDSFFIVRKDTSEIDSLVSLIESAQTREVIREYIIKYIPIKDTVIHTEDGFTIKFWSSNGNIAYEITKPEEDIVVITETVIEEARPITLTLWDKIINATNRFYLWAIIILLLYLSYKIIKTFIPKN